MKFYLLFFGLATSSALAAGLHCDNGDYSLVIDAVSETAKVVHKKTAETFFSPRRFSVQGVQFPRYTITGNAKALRYEGTKYAQWYEGEAVIRTSAKIEGDEVVYSAEFLIDYDPYYTVTTWNRCRP